MSTESLTHTIDDSHTSTLMRYMSSVVISGDTRHLETAKPWVLRICQTHSIMSSVDNELAFDEMLQLAANRHERIVRLPRLALLNARLDV